MSLSKNPALDFIVIVSVSRTVPDSVTSSTVNVVSPFAFDIIVQLLPSAETSVLKLLLLATH
jgi:hypothetical protein